MSSFYRPSRYNTDGRYLSALTSQHPPALLIQHPRAPVAYDPVKNYTDPREQTVVDPYAQTPESIERSKEANRKERETALNQAKTPEDRRRLQDLFDRDDAELRDTLADASSRLVYAMPVGSLSAQRRHAIYDGVNYLLRAQRIVALEEKNAR